MALDIFARYRSIIDDWGAFSDALGRPLPLCAWANPSRASTAEVVARLRADGLTVEQVGWYPGAFRIRGDVGIGTRLEYLAGLLHVQEEVALIPALLLAPQPGERILDLCAAPGNKTAQLAVMMRHRGTVVANDYNFGRMKALRHTIDRLGLENVTATLYNAANYPRTARRFDGVLADVPCSCEGTSRKNPEVLSRPIYAGSLHDLQTAILRRGLRLCKPGGRVVYATCTYAPEENEMVVQEALDAVGSKIEARIVEVDLPGLRRSPGLLRWAGQTFRKDMANALRIYPHQNDTGGFFVAVIEKDSEKGTREERHPPADLQEVDGDRWLAFVQQRFGLSPTLMSEYRLFRANAKTVGLVNQDHRPPWGPAPQGTGLPFVHTRLTYPKLTTAAALKFGRAASKNVVEANREQANAFLSGNPFELPRLRLTAPCSQGYVIVRHDGMALGVGFLAEHGRHVEVFSMFPKAWQLTADQSVIAE